jgi:probable HAF family extracellular repeat protein
MIRLSLSHFLILAVLLTANSAQAAPRYSVVDLGGNNNNNSSDISAYALNSLGQVAGVEFDSARTTQALLYANNMMTRLGTLCGDQSTAFGISNSDQVVGSADVAGDLSMHGFLYSGGAMLDLNSLIDPASGWTINDARDINDSQQIAAIGCKGSVCHALRLDLITAVPESGSWAMILAGLALLAGASHRHRQRGRPH